MDNVKTHLVLNYEEQNCSTQKLLEAIGCEFSLSVVKYLFPKWVTKNKSIRFWMV